MLISLNPMLAYLKAYMEAVIVDATAELERIQPIIEADSPNSDWGSDNENLGYYLARKELAERVLSTIENGIYPAE